MKKNDKKSKKKGFPHYNKLQAIFRDSAITKEHSHSSIEILLDIKDEKDYTNVVNSNGDGEKYGEINF